MAVVLADTGRERSRDHHRIRVGERDHGPGTAAKEVAEPASRAEVFVAAVALADSSRGRGPGIVSDANRGERDLGPGTPLSEQLGVRMLLRQ